MLSNNLLEQYFGVAKCYLILDNYLTQDTTKDNYDSNGNDELKKLLIERDILTESNIFMKNGKIYINKI